MNEAAPFTTERYAPRRSRGLTPAPDDVKVFKARVGPLSSEPIEGGRAPRFELIAFEKIRPDDGAQYLVKGLLPSTGLVVVWGAPKCGKSFLDV